jgi:hypothetical protein
MPLPIEIQNALQIYDNNKGFWRRLFRRDQAAIRALRTLSDTDQSNLLKYIKIYQCFIGNLPKPTQESYKVYQAVLTYLNEIDLSEIPDVMNELHTAKLLKHINLDRLNNLDVNQFQNLASILKKLSNVQLLTQQNLTHIAPYFEAPEKLSIIASVVNAQTDSLNQENFSAFSKLLFELYKNQLLTQENSDQLVRLPTNSLRVLTYLLESLNSNHLLTQQNFDSLAKHLETPEILGVIASAVDILADANRLTQDHLSSLLKVPIYAVNMATALMVLDHASLLTSANRDKLCHADNQFLLSNEACSFVWRPLKTYLPRLDISKRQVVFDQLIDRAQQENPEEKIENYMRELNSESSPRMHCDVKFNTAPPASRRNNEDSLVSDEYKQYVRQPTP